MKLYHYIQKGNKVFEEGLLSFAKSPYTDTNYYVKRSGQKTKAGIIQWMENCFEGRSRGLRFFTTPLKWTQKSLRLKELVDNCDLLELDVDALEKDGFIEKVLFKPSVFDKKYQPPKDFDLNDEYLIPLNSVHGIDLTYKQTWDKCDDSKGLRMAPLRFYVLVIKGGVIPPQYLKKSDNM